MMMRTENRFALVLVLLAATFLGLGTASVSSQIEAAQTALDDDKKEKKGDEKDAKKKRAKSKKSGADKKKDKKDKKKDGTKDGDEDDALPVVAFKDAKVITVSGRTLRRGTVVIKDGKIHAVGESVEIPEGATVVDCTGKTICPGFVSALAWGVGLGMGRFGFNASIGEATSGHDHAHHHGHSHGGHSHAGCATCDDSSGAACTTCDKTSGCDACASSCTTICGSCDKASGCESCASSCTSCTTCDEAVGCDACGSTHSHAAEGPHYADGDVGYAPSKHAHEVAHGSGCVCADIDIVFRAQNMVASPTNRLSAFAPDPASLFVARFTSKLTAALPFSYRSTGWFLGVDTGDSAIKGELNPDGRDVMMMNAAGITTAWLAGNRSAPEFAMLFGMTVPPTAGTDGCVVRMARGRLDDMFVSTGRFLVMDLRNVTGLRRYKLMKEIDSVERYLKDKAEYDEALKEYTAANKEYKADKKKKKKDLGPAPKKPTKVKKPKAVAKWMPLIEKKRVLRTFATSVPQIRLALTIKKRLGIELAIEDAAEAWAIADEIGRANATVIVNPRRRLDATDRVRNPRTSIYRYGWSIENAAKLHAAGVRVVVVPPLPLIGTVGIPGRDLLTFTFDAAFAVRGGLDRDEALKAITLNAAEVLGIADRAGSIDVGKDADLLVLDGDPLHHHTFVEKTYIGGRLMYEKDKEKLFDYVRRGEVVKPIWKWKTPPPGQEKPGEASPKEETPTRE